MTFRDLRGKLTGALARDDVSEARRLLQAAPELTRQLLTDRTFQGAMVFAIRRVSVEMIQTLIEAGLDINRHDGQDYVRDGSYPLDMCVTQNSFDNAKFLLEQGADPNLCDALNSLSYMKAEPADQIKMCELLLDYGADINKELKYIPGYTPICRALENGCTELAEYMLSRGAVLPALPDEPERQLDLDTFQKRLEDACRKCWNSVRREYPEETFCLFGLQTDSDCVVLAPLFDSHQAIDRDLKKRRHNRRSGTTYIERVSLDADHEFYDAGMKHLEDLGAELNSAYGSQETRDAYVARKKSIMAALQGALSNLDKQGLFGTGAEREKILLVVSISDADEDEWKTTLKIIKRLNPPAVWKLFIKSLN